MKYLVLLPLILTMCSPVPAIEIKGNTITLTPQELAACADGCVLVTAGALEEFRITLILAIRAAQDAKSTCKRHDI